MANILALISQYELLDRLANYISTIDLLHLATTNSELYSLIRKPDNIFNRLKSVALYDGYGLKMRQDFKGIYELQPWDYIWLDGRYANFDEELEVRVWNLKCDSTNGLPCLRCSINVCEECRYVPRVLDIPNLEAWPKPNARPSGSMDNIMGFCDVCDPVIESNLPFSLSEYCDCNQYTRWICLPCRDKERESNWQYFEKCTKRVSYTGSHATDIRAGKWIPEVNGIIGFWCPCGERVPKDGHIRCSWCTRRHNPDRGGNTDAGEIPFFDNDPCYPKRVVDITGHPIMYPRLSYSGPIFQL